MDPHRRISAKDAMQHPYFNNLEKVSFVALPLDTPWSAINLFIYAHVWLV